MSEQVNASNSQSTSPTPPSRVAAFFDLDKTIIATSSAYAFGKEFMNHGLISTGEALHLSLVKGSYMVTGHSSEQMDASRDQLTSLVAGWSVEEVTKVVKEAMHTVVTPVIYSEARELIEFHKNEGHDVIIISASASHLVDPIAKELGIDQVIASELEVEDGRFTGNLLFYAKGPAKQQAILDLAQEHGYDLHESFAYSDSATDIPMLEAVGNPVAINPDRALKKHAMKANWEIRSFKDPVPLFKPEQVRDIGIGAGVIAALAAVTAGGVWLAQRSRSNK